MNNYFAENDQINFNYLELKIFYTQNVSNKKWYKIGTEMMKNIKKTSGAWHRVLLQIAETAHTVIWHFEMLSRR